MVTLRLQRLTSKANVLEREEPYRLSVERVGPFRPEWSMMEMPFKNATTKRHYTQHLTSLLRAAKILGPDHSLKSLDFPSPGGGRLVAGRAAPRPF